MKWVKYPKNLNLLLCSELTVEGVSLLLDGKFLCKKEKVNTDTTGVSTETTVGHFKKTKWCFLFCFNTVPTLLIISFYFCLLFFSPLFVLGCTTAWDLNSLTSHGILCPSAVEMQSFKHWTTREFPTK